MKLIIKDQNGQILHDSPLQLSGEGLKIGRSETCQIVVKNLSISREQVQLQLDPDGRTMIQDLQSTFGTMVNGKKIQSSILVEIHPGDRIQLSEEVSMSIEQEKGDAIPTPSGQEDHASGVFPFFMESNERYVRDLFQLLKDNIPDQFHSRVVNTEESLVEKTREMSAILEVSFALNSILNFQRVLEYTIDMAIKVTGAERGFILLHNEELDKLETVVMRRMGTGEVERDMKASSSLVLKCFKTGETIVIGDTSIDPSISGNKSIVINRIRSVALTPLRIQNSPIGVLYLDNRVSPNTFNNRVQDLLKVFAAQASVAIHNSRLFHLATTDGLTGLTNHKHFQQRLLEEFCRAQRHKKPFSLLMIDIDHFKSINDQFGHPVGDQALRILARILRANMRIHDVPARYGGEEFAIVLPETSAEGANFLAEKLRKLVEDATFSVNNKAIKITISIGQASTDEKMSKPSELLRAADQALYKAKDSGRNCVAVAASEPPDPPPGPTS